MAAYAALVSLMHIIDDIKHHHSPPISIDKQQSESLTQIITSLQEFLESHNTSSSVTEIDEADPLEMRIADAAYEAEDIIESHIVNRILRADSQHPRNAIVGAEDIIKSHIVNRSLPARSQLRRNGIIRFFNCFRASKKPTNIPFSEDAVHRDHQINIPFSEDASHHDDQTNIPFSEVAVHHDDQTNLYEELKRVIEEMESIKKVTVEIDAQKEVVHHQQLRPVDASTAPSKSFSTRQNSIMVCSDDVINEVMDKLITFEEPDLHVIPIVGMGGIGKTTLAKNVYGQKSIKVHFDICAWATISQQYNAKEILCEVLSQATKEHKENLGEKSEHELGTKLHQYLFGRRYLIVLDDMWSIDAWDKIKCFLPNNENGSRVLVTTRLSPLSSQLNESYSHHMKFLDKASSWDLFSKIVFGEDTCPSELEDMGKKIVDNCRGLPLSIVVVGGILKKIEYTLGCWEPIEKNLTSLVNLENDKHCLRLLRMSYSHLPAYLKPCFLYMGVFKEDSEIKVSTLIKLWVGEGFLKPRNDESVETIGKGFLKELVDINLILVALGSTGNIKFCIVHDLLRDLCLSESKKDGFYHVIEKDSPPGIDRRRRLVVIARNTSEKKVLEELRSMSHVRSVISEYEKVPSCKNFRLVRALNAYKSVDKIYVDSDAFQYVNLRHLAVGVGSMSSFFSSITLHWNLHTLIVWCSQNSTAPVEIWKMPQFRSIEFVKMRLFLPDPPSDAVVMENLQILKVVENFKFGENVVKRIPNIKKLALHYSGPEGIQHEDYYCLSNIQQLHKLESLNVSLWIDFRKVESLNKLTFPHSLKKLSLSVGKFEYNDILEKIGSLPFLEKLKFWEGGFRRGKWEVADGQFPCLKYLGIFSCSNLRKLTTQDESSNIFPSLEQLHLFHLEELEEIPSEIGEITTLQKISVILCGASVVKRAKQIVEEQMYLQGDDLPFKVVVGLEEKNKKLQSLAGPNFEFEDVSPATRIVVAYTRYLRHHSEQGRIQEIFLGATNFFKRAYERCSRALTLS